MVPILTTTEIEHHNINAMMVLPPIETTPVVLLRFTSKADQDLVTFVKQRLAEGSIAVVTEERTSDGCTLLGLSTTQKELEREAELVKLVKPTTTALVGYAPDGEGTFRNNAILEHFTVAARENFLRYPDTYPRDVDPITEYDGIGLFTSSDRAMLVWSILDSINVLPIKGISSNLSRKLDELNVPYLHSRYYAQLHHDDNNSSTTSSISKFALKRFPFSRLSAKDSSDDDQEVASQCLRHVLEDSGLADVITPAHIPHISNKILQETLDVRTGPPLRAMRDYYGEEIAFYFAWMNEYTRWLLVPGCMGLVIFVVRMFRGDTVDTCDLTPFHGLGTFLWAVLFLRFWDRQEARLAYDWGTFSSTGYERKYFGSRPEFEGELRPSPVTGAMEKYYPPAKRRLKYAASAVVTCILLAGAFFVMILSLNLQGYVRPRDDRGRWSQDTEHPFYYPMIATFAEEGNIFDAASHWKCFLPVVLHVMVVMIMNKAYRGVAEKLTEWENHETTLGHENSLILKRFLFEAFDAYVILFYLAFFEKDITKLRGELVSVFNVDTFRRLLVECALPMALQRVSKDKQVSVAARKKTDDITSDSEAYTPLSSEANRDEYEQFDDYLEMLIELGYVTLFAAAYPFAAFIAIFANLVEYRADTYKLSKLCLRPRSIRTDSIGTWKLLMKCIVWGSALTNCLIFCFTSRQMYQWMPDAFTFDDASGHKTFVAGKGWYVVLTMFGIERALLVCGMLIMLIIPSIPEDVTQMEERRQFVREQTAQKIRASDFLKKRMDEGSIDFGAPMVAERRSPKGEF